jgi:histidine ammonia-lyase
MPISKVKVDGDTLSIGDVVAVARNNAQVTLAASAQAKVETAAKLVAQWTEAGDIIYGVTTGFGPLSEIVIPENKALELQRSLLVSHAAGVDAPLSTEVVRAAMLLRANTLAKGYSGIRLTTLKTLLDLINKGVHPIIPSKGSVGASGDLAPLAHMALVLIGEGQAEYNGEILTGIEALKRAKIKQVTLERKEGLALINGTQIMTALAVLAIADARNLIASAEIAAALSIEALEGVLDHFDHRIHAVRPHIGQQKAAKNLLVLLKGSKQVVTSRQRGEIADKNLQQLRTKIKSSKDGPSATETLLMQAARAVFTIDQQLAVEPTESAASLQEQRADIIKLVQRLGISSSTFNSALKVLEQSRRVQDAYSLRCTPQVFGAARDAIEYAAKVVSTEINSATDNPLIFPTTRTYLSGGNFHGQPIAIAMDLLAIAVTSIGSISERRVARLIDNNLSNGLPLLLLQPVQEDRGVHYGLGLAQITAASLVAECQTLATPASVTSIPTQANQEDHVSMGTIAARQASEIIRNVEHIIAIELLCAAQGIDLRSLHKPMKLGQGSNIAFNKVRNVAPRVVSDNGEQRDRLKQDTLIHRDISSLWNLIHSRNLLHPFINKIPSFKP